MLLVYTYFSQIVNSFTKISNPEIKTNGILMCRAAKELYVINDTLYNYTFITV